MFVKNIKYYCLIMGALLYGVAGEAQLGGLGGPLLHVTFNQAPTDKISVAGPALQIGHTEFEYTDDVCPPQGMYSVASGVPQDCDNSSLIALFADNTPLPDNNGYMMVLNDVAHPTPRALFEYSTVDACKEVDYQFSAALINLDKPDAQRCTRFSSFTLEVRDGSGALLGSTTTGDMQFALFNMGYHFTKYFVNFRLTEANTLPITVKIIDEAKALSGCHNFVGIDDIKITVTGSKVNIAFDSTPVGLWVKSSCFQDNKSFTMHGTIETNLVNPAVQWEQSADDGITWRDIPGAMGYTLTQNFPVPDTFLFRLRLADQALISHPACGVTSDLLRVQVDGLPPFHAATNNSPVCTGEEIKFNAEGGATYEWYGPHGFYDNLKFPGIYRSALKDSGWYYATIITYGGCRITDSTYVKIIGIEANPSPDTAICAGNSVTLNASDAATYIWMPATGLSDATSRQPDASPGETTVYTVTITDEYGCAGKGQVTVAVKNKIPVTVKINASKYVCRVADSVLFASTVTGAVDIWLWDFGNGITGTEQQPPVQYYSKIPLNISSYTVRLTVTDTAGCSDETSQILKVEDMCNLAVPSAFTPNGDGINDYFWPLNAYKAENISFLVFNRKGVKVFETRNWPDKWDGTFKGEPQDAGTYVWVFEYTDPVGKKQVLKGTVLLLR